MPRPAFAVPSRLPPRAGVGLELAHARDVIAEKADVGFFEIHAENYMGAGGPPLRLLEAIRRDHALSIHGVRLQNLQTRQATLEDVFIHLTGRALRDDK